MLGVTVSHVPPLPAVANTANENWDPELPTLTVWVGGASPTAAENARVVGVVVNCVGFPVTAKVTETETGIWPPEIVMVP